MRLYCEKLVTVTAAPNDLGCLPAFIRLSNEMAAESNSTKAGYLILFMPQLQTRPS